MKVKENPCAGCGHYYKGVDDRFPCCHFEGPEGWAPCEQEDYETEDIDEPRQTVWLVSEDNHGLIAVAADRAAAIDFLISTEWINGCCELWIPEKQDGFYIEDLFSDWQDWLRNTATDDDFENMGFGLEEKEVYEI